MTDLYGVPLCPVCGETGALIALKRREAEDIVLYCPVCGLAWSEPPAPFTVDETNSIEELAPAGVILPNRSDIDALSFRLESLSAEDWLDALTEPRPTIIGAETTDFLPPLIET